MLQLEAEKEKARKAHKEKQHHNAAEQGGTFQDFMPHNDKYNQQQKSRSDLPTDRVYSDTSNNSDHLYYKSLEAQGQGLIQDIKVTCLLLFEAV